MVTIINYSGLGRVLPRIEAKEMPVDIYGRTSGTDEGIAPISANINLPDDITAIIVGNTKLSLKGIVGGSTIQIDEFPGLSNFEVIAIIAADGRSYRV